MRRMKAPSIAQRLIEKEADKQAKFNKEEGIYTKASKNHASLFVSRKLQAEMKFCKEEGLSPDDAKNMTIAQLA
jgi:hypothetical protein